MASRVFRRYLEQIAERVKAFGGDPVGILPSPTGDGGRKHPPEEHKAFTGKIAGLIFDRFGDFEGFPPGYGGWRTEIPQPRAGRGGTRRARLARPAAHNRVGRPRRTTPTIIYNYSPTAVTPPSSLNADPIVRLMASAAAWASSSDSAPAAYAFQSSRIDSQVEAFVLPLWPASRRRGPSSTPSTTSSSWPGAGVCPKLCRWPLEQANGRQRWFLAQQKNSQALPSPPIPLPLLTNQGQSGRAR